MGRILGTALIALACLGSANASAAVIYNGHTYMLTAAASTWTAAEAEAVLAGGHLVAVNDAAENAFLVSAFGGFPDRMWIGFTDQLIEGAFAWSNGDTVTYTNWSASEPNNLGNEDYTVINWSADGNWNDCPNAGCGAHFGIIEIASVPAPAPLALAGLALIGIAGMRRRRIA